MGAARLASPVTSREHLLFFGNSFVSCGGSDGMPKRRASQVSGETLETLKANKVERRLR